MLDWRVPGEKKYPHWEKYKFFPLSAAWKPLADFSFSFQSGERRFEDCMIVPNEDWVLSVQLHNHEIDIFILYPYITLMPLAKE